MAKYKVTWKGAVLISILLLPSSIYLVLTTGRHNFVHLPIVGPREAIEVVDENGNTIVDTVYHQIPDFTLINQDGDTVTREDMLGKIYVADFFFTRCPTICPAMQFSMLRLQNRFVDYNDFALVSHSVDPLFDTPEVLNTYAEELGADLSNWTFLTGEKDSIYKLAYEGYFVNAMEDDGAPGGFLHSEYLVLVDKEGRIRSGLDDDGNIRGVYDGTSDHDVGELIDDIKVLMAEYRLALKKNEPKD